MKHDAAIAAERQNHGSRETGVQKFDHLDPDEMLDALLELASRVVVLEDHQG